jgi:hypothetical protein
VDSEAVRGSWMNGIRIKRDDHIHDVEQTCVHRGLEYHGATNVSKGLLSESRRFIEKGARAIGETVQ